MGGFFAPLVKSIALVVQRIEQPRPKGSMWVQFLPRALVKQVTELVASRSFSEVGTGHTREAQKRGDRVSKYCPK